MPPLPRTAVIVNSRLKRDILIRHPGIRVQYHGKGGGAGLVLALALALHATPQRREGRALYCPGWAFCMRDLSTSAGQLSTATAHVTCDTCSRYIACHGGVVFHLCLCC